MKRNYLKSKAVCAKAICKVFYKVLALCMTMSIVFKSLLNI